MEATTTTKSTKAPGMARKAAVFIGKIALLGLALLVVLVLASRIVEPKDNSPESGIRYPSAYGILGEPGDSIDVLLLGSSIGATSIAPLEMYQDAGFASYQMATKGQHICLTSTMVREAFKNQSPQLVVIEADVAFYHMSASQAVSRVLMTALPVFNYHDRWKTLTPRDFTDAFSEPACTYTDPNKGYTINEKYAAAPYGNDYLVEGGAAEPIPRLNKPFFQDVVDYCTAHGAQVIVVSTPNPSNWTWGRHLTMQAFCDQNGIAFYDMNTEEALGQIGLDWQTDSRDGGDHLNARGGMKVSSVLAQYVAGAYGLPDHRADDAYASWGTAADDFAARIAAIDYIPFTEADAAAAAAEEAAN